MPEIAGLDRTNGDALNRARYLIYEAIRSD